MKFIDRRTNLLTSTKVAVGLMIVLALVSLLGATIPQGQEHGFYVRAYGVPFAGLVRALRLDHIFRTDYYTALLVVLCVMVVACSLKGLPNKIRASRPPKFTYDADALLSMTCSAKLTLAVDREEARLHIADIARKRFYGVRSETKDGVLSLVASKAGFSRYGSSILHLSFIFLLVGGIVLTRLGTRAYETARVGEEFDLAVRGGESLKVAIENFDVEFDRRNNVSDFICDVALRGEQGVLARATIRPNHPLKYGGKEIYLMSYEQDEETPEGFFTSLYDSAGTLVVPHLYVGITAPSYIDEIGATVQAGGGSAPRVTVRFDDGHMEFDFIRQTRATEKSAAAGYQFVMMYPVPSVFVTLEVVEEPGQWLILVGFALLSLGVFASLYLSHRAVMFVVKPLPGERTEVVMGGRANRNRDGLAGEFETLRRTLEELS